MLPLFLSVLNVVLCRWLDWRCSWLLPCKSSRLLESSKYIFTSNPLSSYMRPSRSRTLCQVYVLHCDIYTTHGTTAHSCYHVRAVDYWSYPSRFSPVTHYPATWGRVVVEHCAKFCECWWMCTAISAQHRYYCSHRLRAVNYWSRPSCVNVGESLRLICRGSWSSSWKMVSADSEMIRHTVTIQNPSSSSS